MATGSGKLNALSVSREKAPGFHCDGGGLYLQVTQDGARTWVFRFKLLGKAREMGLGSLRDVSLAEARKRAAECRFLKSSGADPIEARRNERQKAKLEAARALTFKDCAYAYIDAHSPSWRNEKHIAQWSSTLEAYAFPVLGNLSVQAVDTALVMKVLEPIWTRKPSTAARVRGRIESVLAWAATKGNRTGENPARWKWHLENMLPPIAKIKIVQHHSALPYDEMPIFMADLRERSADAARALEFAILTASRTSEVIGAIWKEIDVERKVWTIPAVRMKAAREHRVPLSPRCLEIIEAMRKVKTGDFLFPGPKPGEPLSTMAMAMLLRRMSAEITVHGFRSSFRDWASETTGFPHEVCEMALAHTIANKAEAAYRRGDLFEKRRKLMAAWAGFCAKVQSAEVVNFRRPAAAK